MQLISKFNKGFRFFSEYVIDIYSKYTWIIPLNDKKEIAITDSFQKILDESNRQPNKISVDKNSEFYNRSMQSLLKKNDIEIYPIHELDDIANKYNNTYHSTIKMKPVDVKLSTYIDSSKEISPYHAKSSNSINFLIFCLP